MVDTRIISSIWLEADGLEYKNAFLNASLSKKNLNFLSWKDS